MRRHCNLVSAPVLRSNAKTDSLIRPCSQLTPLSNGITISYIDATELQAIAILWVARRETEEKYNAVGSRNWGSSLFSLQHENGCLSLKKSLEKFLQKRKDRIQASMPY